MGKLFYGNKFTERSSLEKMMAVGSRNLIVATLFAKTFELYSELYKFPMPKNLFRPLRERDWTWIKLCLEVATRGVLYRKSYS